MMSWHQVRIVARGVDDSGYDQDLTVWVEAFGRASAVAKAMIDGHVWSDSELVRVEVLQTVKEKPDQK